MRKKQATELSKTELYECMAIRKYELERIIEEKQNSIERAPKGLLRASKSRGSKSFQYYVRQHNEPNGQYLRKKDEAIARRIAQREYDEKLIEMASMEIEQIKKFLAKCPEDNIINLYEKVPEGKKILITPISLSDEEFAKKWMSIPFQGKSTEYLNTEYYTEKGEHVRSKSEVLIANMLKRMGIPYKYECPLVLDDGTVFHPDFTVMNIRTRQIKYWEHLGMMDDPEYRRNALQRINQYKASGFYPGTEVIYTHETGAEPISTKDIKETILKYLV